MRLRFGWDDVYGNDNDWLCEISQLYDCPAYEAGFVLGYLAAFGMCADEAAQALGLPSESKAVPISVPSDLRTDMSSQVSPDPPPRGDDP